MDDLISRQAAIDSIMEEPSEARYPVFYAEKIRQLPSAQREAEWIPGKELSREFIGTVVVHVEYEKFTCSACGFTVEDLLYHVDGSPFYKFCPNCGAKMEKEKE